MNTFRTFKIETCKPRKDGGQLTKSYGCNGYVHYVTYDRIWYNEKGHGVDGQSDVLPPKFLGKCTHGKDCKNYGGFVITPQDK